VQAESYRCVRYPFTTHGSIELIRTIRCKNYQLSNFFPARVLAAACTYVTFQDYGLNIRSDKSIWLEEVTSGKADMEDFDEVVNILDS
jgi:hypothetical protein